MQSHLVTNHVFTTQFSYQAILSQTTCLQHNFHANPVYHKPSVYNTIVMQIQFITNQVLTTQFSRKAILSQTMCLQHNFHANPVYHKPSVNE